MAATITTAAQNDAILLVTGTTGKELQKELLYLEGVEEGDYTNGEIYDLIRWKQGQTPQPDWYPKGV